jgi:SnoaL-like domain
VSDDERAIRHLIGRFANAFDLKAWDALEDCLAESLHTDYSDLRGSPPETLSRRQFVDRRRSALERLQTHHLSGNHEITVEGDRGRCRASMVIWRRSDDGRALNTHCLYEFGVSRTATGWQISSIVQTVLWNDGEIAIHTGIRRDAQQDRQGGTSRL